MLSSQSPTPHGVGGLKSEVLHVYIVFFPSHPSRGGWIEINLWNFIWNHRRSPTPHGVGGLKSALNNGGINMSSPTPHGVGGLKSFNKEV